MISKKIVHRLSQSHSKVWLTNPKMRNEVLARNIANYYGGKLQAITVCDNFMIVIGYIKPDGRTQLQPRPRPRLEAWQCSNPPKLDKPPEQGGCICQNFFSPEALQVDPSGRWSALKSGKHHPFCEFTKGSLKNYNAARQQRKVAT